jgi:hypothetical protein
MQIRTENKNNFFTENTLKHRLKIYLISQGWNFDIINKANHGLYIVASRSDEKWVIIISGNKSNNFVEYFVSAIGSAVHIMDNPVQKYSIVLPDTTPFRNLWKRLSAVAKRRTRISALFVNGDGDIVESV